MQTKTYLGDSIAQAVEKARQDWGKGIILLDSEKVDSGFPNTAPGYRITVGVDELTRRMRPWRPRNLANKQDEPVIERNSNGGFKQVFKRQLQNPQPAVQENDLMAQIAEIRSQMLQMHEQTKQLLSKGIQQENSSPEPEVQQPSDEVAKKDSQPEQIKVDVSLLSTEPPEDEQPAPLPESNVKEDELLDPLPKSDDKGDENTEIPPVVSEAVPADTEAVRDDVEKPSKDELLQERILEGEFGKTFIEVMGKMTEWKDREKAVLSELNALREQIRRLNEQQKPFEDIVSEPYASVLDRLLNRGLKEEIAQRVIRLAILETDNVSNTPVRVIQEKIKTSLKPLIRTYVFPKNLPEKGPKTIFLVGPTGSGKSSISMRIASNPKLTGTDNVGIIALNRYGRVSEVLKVAEQSGVDVIPARNISEYDAAREAFSDKSLLLVDTPGRSPFAAGHLNDLESYIRRTPFADVFMVLSATSDSKDALLACGLYLLVDPTGLIITKFDETTLPGKIFSLLDEINLPLVCFSDTDKVMDDLTTPSADYLFDKLFDSQ